MQEKWERFLGWPPGVAVVSPDRGACGRLLQHKRVFTWRTPQVGYVAQTPPASLPPLAHSSSKCGCFCWCVSACPRLESVKSPDLVFLPAVQLGFCWMNAWVCVWNKDWCYIGEIVGTGGSCVLLALRQDGAIVGAPGRGTCCPGFSETPLLGPWLLRWWISSMRTLRRLGESWLLLSIDVFNIRFHIVQWCVSRSWPSCRLRCILSSQGTLI